MPSTLRFVLVQTPQLYLLSYRRHSFSMMPPRYLFRVWSDQAHGTNSPTLFLPSKMKTTNPVTAAELRAALVGKKKGSRFVFATSSLLCALQHAISKSKKENRVRIICMDTEMCNRRNRGPVQFISAAGVLRKAKAKNVISRWSSKPLDFSDVYFTTTSIIPGQGSYWISFQSLKNNGLFNLYPELGIINSTGRPGFETPITNLRSLWLETPTRCTVEEIDLAIKIASTFVALRPPGEEDCHLVPKHLLSWFLALKVAESQSARLYVRLEQLSSTKLGIIENETLARSRPVEYDRYCRIRRNIRRLEIERSSVQYLRPDISREEIQRREKAYKKLRHKESSFKSKERTTATKRGAQTWKAK